MYAIVDIAGQQFKVEKNQKIFVHRLDAKEGSKLDFDQVLLIDDDGKVQVGMPVVKNYIVSASVISHEKGDKVKVFKKKKRKGYQKLNGHRQYFTQLLIEGIGEGKAKAPAAKTAEAKPKAEKTEEKKIAEKESVAKETTSKKVEAKKPATKKEPAKAVAEKKTVKPAAKKETKPVAKTTAKKEAKPAAKKAAPKEKKETAPKAKAAPKKKE